MPLIKWPLGFGRRAGAEAAATGPIPDYDRFLAQAGALFERLRSASAGTTSAQVAQVVYTAATDGTGQLRYLATDDIKPWVAARRESSEAAYTALMRKTFEATS